MLNAEDVSQVLALIRAELARVNAPPPQECPADPYAGLRALIARERLVTGREAAAALLGCPAADVQMRDIMRAARALRALGWERCKATRVGGEGRGWHYRPALP